MSILLNITQKALMNSKLSDAQIMDRSGLSRLQLENFRDRQNSYGIDEVESLLGVLKPKLMKDLKATGT